MMGFWGSVSTLIEGSGLPEVLEEYFGPNAIQHVMTGKSILRALRGHILVDAVLGVTLVSPLTSENCAFQSVVPFKLSLEETESIQQAYDNVFADRLPENLECALLEKLK